MAEQKGSDLLLKIWDGVSAFVSLGGQNVTSMTLNKESVEITNKGSANKWRELLAGAGVKSMSVSGSLIFQDDANDTLLHAAWAAAAFTDFELIVPDFGTFTGAFEVTSLEYSGDHNAGVISNMTLESAEEIIFATV